jgi:hypothetical protein
LHDRYARIPNLLIVGPAAIGAAENGIGFVELLKFFSGFGGRQFGGIRVVELAEVAKGTPNLLRASGRLDPQLIVVGFGSLVCVRHGIPLAGQLATGIG